MFSLLFFFAFPCYQTQGHQEFQPSYVHKTSSPQMKKKKDLQKTGAHHQENGLSPSSWNEL